MKLNDNSQRYKDARQIMSEKLADSRKESAAEKAKRLKEVCSQCAYWTSENSSYGTCDYIGYEGHQRPCSGTKCVETEVFKPLLQFVKDFVFLLFCHWFTSLNSGCCLSFSGSGHLPTGKAPHRIIRR